MVGYKVHLGFSALCAALVYYFLLFLAGFVSIPETCEFLNLPYSKFNLVIMVFSFGLFPFLFRHWVWICSFSFCLIFFFPLLLISSLVEKRFSFVGLLYYLAAVVGYSGHIILDRIFSKRKRVWGKKYQIK